MSDEVSKHLAKAMEAMNKKVNAMEKRLSTQEKINLSNSQELANMQAQLKQMRDRAILDDIARNVPYREIGQKHNLTAGRVAQIKKENFE